MNKLLTDSRLNASELARRIFPDLAPDSAVAMLHKHVRDSWAQASEPQRRVLTQLARELAQLADYIAGGLGLHGRPAMATRRLNLLAMMQDPRLKKTGLARAMYPDVSDNAAILRYARRADGRIELTTAEVQDLTASLTELYQQAHKQSARVLAQAPAEDDEQPQEPEAKPLSSRFRRQKPIA